MSQKHGNLLLRIAGLQVSGVETPRILHELQSLLDPTGEFGSASASLIFPLSGVERLHLE